MDWVFRSSSSPWDFTELERDEFDHNIEAFSIDSGIFGESNWQKHSTMASSPAPPPLPLPLPLPRPSEPLSGSSKKPRGDVNEQYVSSCLVDGCKADLSSCREYHRRHRVCEAHSKTPVVAIAGEHQRFCQQCSRFHSVVEFDEVKRSCRKRLDGHNRRRRKPRADTMYLNNYQRFFTNHRGTKLLQFGASPAYTWPHEEKSNQQLHKLQLSSSSSSSSSLSREKKFPFLLSNYSSSSSSLGQLVEPKHNNDALSLLSNNTSNSSFMAPHLPLTNNNHLIGMIHFRTQGLELENIFLGG